MLSASTPAVTLNAAQLSDLELLAWGALAPLNGFMRLRDYEAVLSDMTLADGTPFGLPVTLALTREQAEPLTEGQTVSLLDPAGVERGRLLLQERYLRDRTREARCVFGTEDSAHPGVRALAAAGDMCLGGSVELTDPPAHPMLEGIPHTPAAVRAAIAERGWRTVVGFQTRNPIHRAHEYLLRCALEMADGLLVHPLMGPTVDDDVPAAVRLACYRALLENHFPADRVLLAAFPAAMRYAGPREAVFHARARRNYGCTHFIVGRDHAGVGNFYGPYDAQHVFERFNRDSLGIVPVRFENAFWCTACNSYASPKTCVHPVERRLALSGTRVREMLREGRDLPSEFTRPEVAEILMRHYQGAPA